VKGLTFIKHFKQCALFLLVSVQASFMLASDYSADVIVLGNEPVLQMGTSLEVLMDPNNDYSPFEIVLPEWTNAWEPYDKPILNLGYVDEAYWLKLNIDSSASIHKQWDLVISTPLLDYVDVYQVFADSGPRLIYRSGMKRAFNNRNEDHRYFIVPLEIYNEISNPDSFLIRIETRSSSFMPMQLYPANDFWAPLQKADVLNWMFFGIIIAMALYNLFLFSSVKDVSYLYYVLFITSFSLLHLSLDGYIFQHFWPADRAYSSAPDTVFSSFSVFFGFLFITNFLDLKQFIPWLHKCILGIVFLQIPIIGFSLYYPTLAMDFWLVPLMGLLLVTAVGIGLYAYAKGLVTARYFVFAWVTFALGNFYMILVFTGTTITTVSPLSVSKMASFAEAMLLSFALARRIRVLREEREKQTLKAEAQSYFLAQISHEIRTPLNGVLGTVDLLDQTTLNNEQQSYVDIIQSSGKSLLTLVNDVLDYSKIEAGKMSVQEEQIAIHDLVTHQVELFRSHASQKDLEFTLHIEPNVPKWISSDSQRLRQVWANIISNAIKFTDTGIVRVTLSIESKDNQNFLVLTVKDSGIGIAANELNNLFNAYQQVEVGKRRVYGGTGLGLAISKELMELLGGTISVHSQLNQGSEFKIWTPLKPVLGLSPVNSDELIEQSRPLSILVAEDNIVNQKVIHGLLSKMGHSVVIVPQGDRAVSERINPDSHFDIILMDCEMPHMDGYEATRLIREFEQENSLPNIPIVALTAHALDEVRKRCLASGMNDFLTKPINTNQLNRSLNSIFITN
jgi:signal transduction histidine kinase